MLLTERYSDKISGVISCFDRVVIQGTLPGYCYNMGMTAYLPARNKSHQIALSALSTELEELFCKIGYSHSQQCTNHPF